jgi:hypothetical protein
MELSAVCAIEMPSLAFLIATVIPLICEVILSLIDKPAASSFAELTLRPDDNLSIEVVSDILVLLNNLWLVNDAMFVLITNDMILSSTFFPACAEKTVY